MSSNLLPEKELNIIRKKLPRQELFEWEVYEFLKYVTALECLLDQCNDNYMFGNKSWQSKMGLKVV